MKAQPLSGPDKKRLRALVETGTYTMTDLRMEFRYCRKAKIVDAITEMGLPVPASRRAGDPLAKERKCMNHSRCGQTHVSRYAGLCKKCRAAAVAATVNRFDPDLVALYS